MPISKTRYTRGIILTPDDIGVESISGELKVALTSQKLQVYLDSGLRNVVTENQVQTLTNKTIDVDNNTVSNIEVDNLKAGVLNTDITLAGATDAQVPSALAVKTYADATGAGVQANLTAHINDASDAHDASAISTVPAGNLSAIDVQGALDELQTDVDTRATSAALTAHITDPIDAHVASAIGNTPSGNLAATDIQGAVNELQTDIDTRVAGPVSSTNDALVTWNGTTGRLVKNNAGVTLNGSSQMAGLASVQSITANIQNVNVSASINEGRYTESALTGANQTLATVNGPFIILTNASLTSIDMLSTPVSGKNITVVNRTGNAIIINNDTGGTAANRILTGTKAALSLGDQASLLLKYDDANSRWAVIGGSGSGGGQSLDTIFQLTGLDIASWSTGNNATFLGGGTMAGTFAADTTTPLQGTSSYLYTQAPVPAVSVNDYAASPAQAVDVRFRGQNVTLYMPSMYNGLSTDIQWIFYDATNAAIIPSSVFIPLQTGTSTIFKTNIVIPLTCASIRVGFHVRTTTTSAVFEFDSVQMTSDTTIYADVSNQTQSSYISQTATFTNATITGVTSSSLGSGNYTYNSGTGIYTVNRRGIFSLGFQSVASAAASTDATIVVNGANVAVDTSLASLGAGANAAYSQILPVGATFEFKAVGGSSSSQRISVSSSATNTNIVTAPDTFSTDTNALTYAGSATYTLATLANAPVGTFITFTYAINTNTRTQTTTAPTQTTADMNTNGILVYTRAYNAASTAAQPAVVAVQIGKGLKGISLGLYKSAGKTLVGSLDVLQAGTTGLSGMYYKEYTESTGILLLDAGVANPTITTHVFEYSDVSSAMNGYITINASKNPALTGLNISAVAARGVNTSGQSIGTTPTTMTYDASKTFDTHGALNAATGVFTSPETGYYQVNASVLFNSAAYSLAQAVGVIGYKNAVIYSQSSQERTNAAVTQNVGDDYSDIVYLVKGDTFEIRPFNDRGATALSPSANNNFFSIAKVSIG